MTLSLLLSLQVMSATVPRSWITDTDEIEKSEDMSELDKSLDNILDTKSDLIEDTAKNRSEKNRRWFLQSIQTGLAIETKGSIGVLGMGGEKAVSLIWQRNKDSIKRLQEKYYGKSVEGQDKSLESEITPNGDTVVMNSESTKVDLEKQIAPLVEATFVAGKVKNKSKLKEKLLSKLSDYQKLLKEFDNAPQMTPWWVYKFQFELSVTAEGEVAPFVEVGGQVRLKVEWYRIQRKANDKMMGEPSKNVKTLMAMASDFATLDELALGRNNDKRFVLDTIKVGLGIEAEGEVVVAEVKGKVFGSVFFKRERITNKSDLIDLPTTFPVAAAKTDGNLNLAHSKGIKVRSMDKSLDGSAIYMATRENFRKGLKKAVRMAKFFSRGALKREDRRLAAGKEVNFNLNVIELELEVFLSGGVGVATVEGAAELELFLVRN